MSDSPAAAYALVELIYMPIRHTVRGTYMITCHAIRMIREPAGVAAAGALVASNASSLRPVINSIWMDIRGSGFPLSLREFATNHMSGEQLQIMDDLLTGVLVTDLLGAMIEVSPGPVGQELSVVQITTEMAFRQANDLVRDTARLLVTFALMLRCIWTTLQVVFPGGEELVGALFALLVYAMFVQFRSWAQFGLHLMLVVAILWAVLVLVGIC